MFHWNSGKKHSKNRNYSKKGGLALSVQVPQSELDKELVASVLKEYKIHNADVVLNEDAT